MMYSPESTVARKYRKTRSLYEERINGLRVAHLNTDHIERGIEDIQAVLDKGGKSFVVYGEPQSGKTEVMIALTCRLLDRGFRTIFVIMNDNTELEEQNFKRFLKVNELNPSPSSHEDIVNSDEKYLKKDIPRVIFCRKNVKNLEKLIHACRFMGERVVIDDEADYASVNTKINKDKQTAINENVEKLISSEKGGIYIGVTATPGRLDLNNTFLNKASDWVFIEPYQGYKGRSFFFPETNSQQSRSDYILTKLPEQGDDKQYLIRAIYRFLIRVSMLNTVLKDGDTHFFSMLIHTGGKKDDHQIDKQTVDKVVSQLNDIAEGNLADEKINSIIKKLKNEIAVVDQHFSNDEEEAICDYIFDNIGKTQVLVINSDEDKRNVERGCDPLVPFTFAIGGNIVSRGLTFNNLLSFFFSRTVKGKFQQNTYIQRARMFGNRKLGERSYTKYFELAIPENLFVHWAELFSDHEQSILSGKAGHYVHYQRKKNSAADHGAVDKANVRVWRDSGGKVGEVFSYTKEVEQTIFAGRATPLATIERLIDNNDISFPRAFLLHIRNMVEGEESRCAFGFDEDGFNLFSLQRDDGSLRYEDADLEDISRAGGGMVQGKMMKDNPSCNVIFLPVTNGLGQMRFYCRIRGARGQQVLLNKLNKPK
jgi:hypothetical protein